ncbi:MAG: DeoR/GlpR family DNA-binding transcription regulator [Coriobacteriia bacterium]|nr:DeoR/GlpR family DNA-binding transcription regulator [Coriobacteriia bacterium]
MFLEERQQRIVKLLEAHGRVAVTELAQSFDVTEDCIRKDLKQLANNGKCRRVYGGATAVQTPPELNVVDRIGTMVPQKRVIAAKAVELIRPEMTVFLDISTTNLFLAQLIAERQICCNVVSTMIGVLRALAKSPEVTALCPGGTLRMGYDGFVGGSCVTALENYRFDLSFMGCYGVDPAAQEITTHAPEDGIVKQAVVARTKQNYLIAESRKLMSFGSYRYAGFDDFEALICDDDSPEGVAAVRNAGLKVL